jgi:hypothetical protein
MNNFFKRVLLSFLTIFTAFTFSACKFDTIEKKPTQKHTSVSWENCSSEMAKFRNTKIYNYNLSYSTNNVINKANEIKQKLMEIGDVEIESFSINDSNASIRAYTTGNNADKEFNILSNDPEISSFNKSYSNAGSSYVNYLQYYYFYKALLENYDEINDTLLKDNDHCLNEIEMKTQLQSQMNNYKSNIDSYKAQMERNYIQISISKKS